MVYRRIDISLKFIIKLAMLFNTMIVLFLVMTIVEITKSGVQEETQNNPE